jgi:hypothetical protein
MAEFKMDDYNTVPQRIAEFREKHPNGSLQPVNLDNPFQVVTIGADTFIAYAAAAYREPDDPRPGIGVAYEPVPGKTPYTKNSELQNAETSAWGRAIVAALAADAKKGIATADEVRNRNAERDLPPPRALLHPDAVARFLTACEEAGVDFEQVVDRATAGRTMNPAEVYADEAQALRDAKAALVAEKAAVPA